MKLHAAVCATDSIALLPELVAGVSCTLSIKRAVQTGTVDVLGEGLFVAALVDVCATLCASQVAFSFFKAVFVWCWRLFLLGLKDVPDDLQSGKLLAGLRCFWAWAGTGLFGLKLNACFPKSVLKLLGR